MATTGCTPTHSTNETQLAAIASTLPQQARAIAERHWGIGRAQMPPAEIADELRLTLATVARVIGSLRRTVSANRREPTAPPAARPISRKKTTMGRTVLEVCGVVVTRHGENDYRIDGVGRHSADEVGIAISKITDLESRKRVGNLLKKRDEWIFDGFRAARYGNQWPHNPIGATRLAISQG